MTVVPFVSVEEYRRSHYEPDVDYVDGVLEERNTCLLDHSEIQGELAAIIRNERDRPGACKPSSPRAFR